MISRSVHEWGRLARTSQTASKLQKILYGNGVRSNSSAVLSAEIASTKAVPPPNIIPNVPLWQRLGPLTQTFQAYGRAQRNRPYATQLCSSLVIYALGDISAQRIRGEEYEVTSTGRNLIIGGTAAIPGYLWFMFLGRHFNYASKIRSIATKVFVNQLVFTPVFNTYFFSMQTLLAGDGIDGAIERVKKTVPISMYNSIKLWPVITAFSFTYVDQHYRALFHGVIAIGWQSYLSWLNAKAASEETRSRS
ncbi:hypothetical protein MMC25_003946 [Agyrium rufum]|nr:hypothetical protein [Agyrium rufum]